MKKIKLSLGRLSSGMLFAAAFFGSISAHAADRYNLKIETGILISSSCTTEDGQIQTSHIELLLEDSQATDPASLTSAVARVRACSPFTSAVRENIPMVVPVRLLKQIA